MKIQKITLSFLFLFSILNLCFAQGIEEKFQYILDSTYQANPDAIGLMMHIEAPDNKVSWTSSVGFSDKNTKEKLDKDQPVLIASNTKTYVSATVLKLVENKLLELDQSIAKLLYRKTKKKMKKVGYAIDKITVRHLLSHTSGITDYVTKDYFSFVNTHPQHKWTRSEQIDWAMKIAKPIETGKEFAYADINFVLLTEIIERKTGQPFYLAIRDLLEFEKHNLNTTWFVDLQEKPSSSLAFAHQYSEKKGWDSYDLDPSWDLYGGGGLAANTKDLALFFQLLFTGQIIKDEAILSEMYSYVIPKEDSKNYCLGLYHFPSFFGQKAYYHGGFWGTDVMFLPEMNTTVSIFVLQKEKRELNAQTSSKMVKILQE